MWVYPQLVWSLYMNAPHHTIVYYHIVWLISNYFQIEIENVVNSDNNIVLKTIRHKRVVDRLYCYVCFKENNIKIWSWSFLTSENPVQLTPKWISNVVLCQSKSFSPSNHHLIFKLQNKLVSNFSSPFEYLIDSKMIPTLDTSASPSLSFSHSCNICICILYMNTKQNWGSSAWSPDPCQCLGPERERIRSTFTLRPSIESVTIKYEIIAYILK